MISVKEYAEERNKSIQAVHQQRKRKKYKARLDGHVFEKDGTFYLDDEAVKILDSAHETTVQVVDTNTKEKIQRLEKQLETEKNRNSNLLSEINKKSKKFEDLQMKLQAQTEQMAALLVENKEKTLLLEQKEDQSSRVDALAQENAELKAKIDLLKETNDQLVKEKESRSVSEGKKEPKKGFFAKLFGR